MTYEQHDLLKKGTNFGFLKSCSPLLRVCSHSGSTGGGLLMTGGQRAKRAFLNHCSTSQNSSSSSLLAGKEKTPFKEKSTVGIVSEGILGKTKKVYEHFFAPSISECTFLSQIPYIELEHFVSAAAALSSNSKLITFSPSSFLFWKYLLMHSTATFMQSV